MFKLLKSKTVEITVEQMIEDIEFSIFANELLLSKFNISKRKRNKLLKELELLKKEREMLLNSIDSKLEKIEDTE